MELESKFSFILYWFLKSSIDFNPSSRESLVLFMLAHFVVTDFKFSKTSEVESLLDLSFKEISSSQLLNFSSKSSFE